MILPTIVRYLKDNGFKQSSLFERDVQFTKHYRDDFKGVTVKTCNEMSDQKIEIWSGNLNSYCGQTKFLGYVKSLKDFKIILNAVIDWEI